MLGSIRKFSTSWYAKILLGIVVIPFIFWGMGGVFTGGNKNVVVVIDKEKFSTQEFANFVSTQQIADKKIDSRDIDKLASKYVAFRLLVNKNFSYSVLENLFFLLKSF